MDDLLFLLWGVCVAAWGSCHQLSHLAAPSCFRTLAWHAVNAAGQRRRHFLPRGSAVRPGDCKDFPTLRKFCFRHRIYGGNVPEPTGKSASDSRPPFTWAEPSFGVFQTEFNKLFVFLGKQKRNKQTVFSFRHCLGNKESNWNTLSIINWSYSC